MAAGIAGAAASDWLVADPDGLGLDPLCGECVGDFLERASRVTVFTRTSVDEQYFHFSFPFC